MTKNKKKFQYLIGKRAGFGILLFLVFFGSFLGNSVVKAADPIPDGSEAKSEETSVQCPPVPVENKSLLLPDCTYYEGTPKEQTCGCRNINVFLELLVTVTNFIFEIVGGVSLAMFVYGGYVLLTSGGVSEHVTKGKTILTSAVIGLVIVFTAQLGVQFLLKTLATSSSDLLIK